MGLEYLSGNDPQPSDDEGARQEEADRLAESARLAKKWQDELTASRKWLANFTKAARECERAYLDERNGTNATECRVNLFWSNVQVLLSAIYGRLPKADVERRFKDFDDDVSRVASIILQRILNSDLEREYDDTNAAMRDAVQDRFVSGLGQVWCRYDVQTEEVEEPQLDPMTGQPIIGEDGKPATQKSERILTEEAEVDYVYWDDFRYSPCRRWRDCRWVARRVYMTKRQLAKRFNLDEAQLGQIPMSVRTPGDGGGRTDDVLKATPFKQAAVWEIWEKESNTVCWYVEGCSFVLDYQDDILQLEDFFPCPQPVVATTLTRAFLPRPDYAMAQDLYTELDRLNNKLAQLQLAVKAAGVYDKNNAAVKQLIGNSADNQLLPVENWSGLSEKNGLKGVMDWLPIDAFVNAINQLNIRKQQVEHDLQNVLGISDIMRGQTVASETATAQQIKAQYGGARLSNLQNEVARFVSGVMRIRANIISNHFQPETLVRRSLIDRTPDAQLAQPAIELLKNYGMTLHQVTVTSDSLAAPDWEREKETRTEFMGAVSNYLMAAAPMVQQDPSTGALLIKLLQWGTAGFKGAQTIEGVLDQAARAIEQRAQQPPPPPPPSPEDQKNLAAAKKNDADAERSKAEASKTQLETAIGATSAQRAGLLPMPQPPQPMGPGMGPQVRPNPQAYPAANPQSPLPGGAAPMQ